MNSHIKPEPPKPRLIVEDFLEPKYKYRIKKVSKGKIVSYYPQKRFLFWWMNISEEGTLEEAKVMINYDISICIPPKKIVEYIYEPF
jgi:hypothetical protein